MLNVLVLAIVLHDPLLSQAEGSETGIVLMHGYGGGAFSWRHVLGPLARSTGCRVVAFDRPAFGEEQPCATNMPLSASVLKYTEALLPKRGARVACSAR